MYTNIELTCKSRSLKFLTTVCRKLTGLREKWEFFYRIVKIVF